MDCKQAAYVPIRDLRVCMQQDARVLVQQRHVEIAWTAALPLLLVHGHELTPVTSAILLHHRQRRSQPLPALPALARLPSHGPPQEQGEATPRSFLAGLATGASRTGGGAWSGRCPSSPRALQGEWCSGHSRVAKTVTTHTVDPYKLAEALGLGEPRTGLEPTKRSLSSGSAGQARKSSHAPLSSC